MSEALSQNAAKLLKRVVTLGRDHQGAEVPDRMLWEAANLDPDAYYDAAEQLFEAQLVEREGSDFAKLKATVKGMRPARGL